MDPAEGHAEFLGEGCAAAGVDPGACRVGPHGAVAIHGDGMVADHTHKVEGTGQLRSVHWGAPGPGHLTVAQGSQPRIPEHLLPVEGLVAGQVQSLLPGLAPNLVPTGGSLGGRGEH